MWLSLFLLAICCATCFAQNQSGSASYTPHSGHGDSYKSVEPAYGENPSPKKEETVENPAAEGYEPQNSDTGHPIYDKDIHVELCTYILKAAEQIELMHPETTNVTTIVLKSLIAYMLAISVENGEECDPATHLLDLIIIAAKKLRLDYTKFTENYCTYTEVPVPDESSQTPVYSTEYKTDAPQTSTKVSTSSKYPRPEGAETKTMKPTEKPYTDIPSGNYKPTDAPCTNKSTAGYKPTEKPCTDIHEEIHEETEEIIAEDEYYPYPPFIGSVRGMPGEHYPNYTEIPITSFTCADKKYIPGFYADLETGCQVFHVCYEHRRESFLCPLGTIFNQPILACDYWYSSNCSLAPIYYEVNAKTEEVMKPDKIDSAVDELMSSIVDKQKVPTEASDPEDFKFSEHAFDDIAKFLPVKAKVTVLPEPHSVDETKIVLEKPEKNVEEVASDIFDNILTTATRVVSKTRDSIVSIPKPSEAEMKVDVKKPLPIIKPKLIKSVAAPILKPIAKVKMAKAAVPIVAKVAAAKAVVPIVTKAKLAATVPVKVVATKTIVPVVAKAKLAAKVPIVAKAKLAASVPIATKLAVIPAAKVLATKSVVPAKVLATKVAVPIVAKGKIATVPIAKTVAMKASIPVVAKTKFAAAAVPKVVVKASVPVLKTKVLAASLPFAKSVSLKSTMPVVKAKIVAPPLKAKVFKIAGPVVKGKMLALPLAKSKLLSPVPIAKAKIAKAAAISPLTKKALALGYMKLLKAKKLAFMG